MSNPVTRTRQGLTRRTVLTNAQILALPTTSLSVPFGFELVPAQGVNRVIVPMQAIVEFVWVADYTNIDGSAILMIDIGGAGLSFMSPARNNPDGFVSQILAPGANALNTFQPLSVVPATGLTAPQTQVPPANVVNLPVTLAVFNLAAGDLTGGDPGNSLIVTVFYNVVTLG